MPEKERDGSFKEQLHPKTATNRLGIFLEKFRPYLRSVAARQRTSSLGRRLDTSDIVQDTFVNALRGWSGFTGTTERELAVWLRQILVRRTIDLLRQKDASERRRANWARQQGKYDDLNGIGSNTQENVCPQRRLAQKEIAESVMNAVQNLPPDYRDIIMLRHFHGLTLDEAAAHMCRSYDSAEKLWARGLARLRQILRTTT